MSPSRGAYGLRLPGLPGQQWLGEVPDDWPAWTIRYLEEPADDDEQWVRGDAARLRLRPEGMVDVDRHLATSVLRGLPSPPDAAYVHPILGSTAIMAAEWRGWLTFHGGCVLDPRGRAWALLGEREAGKSTSLVWFYRHGWPVLADDLVVTDGTRVFAGPRCLDLRSGSAQQFALGTDIGVVGTRQRWRVDLGPAPATAPLAGIVVLGWSPETSLSLVALGDKVSVVQQHRALKVGQQHQLPWLDVLGRPLWTFGRPRSWAVIDDAMHALAHAMTVANSDSHHRVARTAGRPTT